MNFKKLPRAILQEKHAQRIFERVWEEIAAQVEDKSGRINRTRFNKIPDEAKAIYWLWLFACEALIDGIDKFILDPLGIYAPETHAALSMVGATELVLILEAAVPLAREGPAEFKRLKDQYWFKQFPPSPRPPTWQSLNRRTFAAGKSLTELVVTFVKSHQTVLFDKR